MSLSGRISRGTAWATPAGLSSARTPRADDAPTATMRLAPVMYLVLTVTGCPDRVTKRYDARHAPGLGRRTLLGRRLAAFEVALGVEVGLLQLGEQFRVRGRPHLPVDRLQQPFGDAVQRPGVGPLQELPVLRVQHV